MKPLILASGSPRRKELLHHLQIPFSICVSDIDEIVPVGMAPADVAMSLAYQKAEDIFSKYPESIVLGADTIVVCDNLILGKPKNEDDAYRMLRMLSGRTHQVMTGVALLSDAKVRQFVVQTNVTFWPLQDDEIHGYIATQEPMDKAGSYGIQGKGSLFVKDIVGDYFSVVGLPISHVYRELQQFSS